MAAFALFKYLDKPELVRAFIIRENGEKVRLEAVARIIAEPYLELKFRPGELPTELVRNGGKILLSLDTRAGTVSMYGHVDEMINARVMRVLATESFAYAQQREFFRINAAIKVIYTKETLSATQSRPVQSSTLNISGSGVLIHAREPLVLGDTYELEFFIPEAESVSCSGLVVRVDAKLRGGFEAAFHFFKVEPENRDSVISFCLAEQRRQLRSKVQIVGF